jgi:hypothetical protein
LIFDETSVSTQVNPGYAFPQVAQLERLLAAAGYALKERLPTHERYFEWMPRSILEAARGWHARGGRVVIGGGQGCEPGGLARSVNAAEGI